MHIVMFAHVEHNPLLAMASCDSVRPA